MSSIRHVSFIYCSVYWKYLQHGNKTDLQTFAIIWEHFQMRHLSTESGGGGVPVRLGLFFCDFSSTPFCEELSLWHKSRELVMSLFNHSGFPVDIFLTFFLSRNHSFMMSRGEGIDLSRSILLRLTHTYSKTKTLSHFGR